MGRNTSTVLTRPEQLFVRSHESNPFIGRRSNHMDHKSSCTSNHICGLRLFNFLVVVSPKSVVISLLCCDCYWDGDSPSSRMASSAWYISNYGGHYYLYPDC